MGKTKEERTVYMREYRARRLAQHKCIICGKTDYLTTRGCYCCFECGEKRRLREEARRRRLKQNDNSTST